MAKSYVGDAIVYEGNTSMSKVIRFLSKGGKITHCGFRLDEDSGESIEWDLVKRESKILFHDLNDPDKDYISYEIYEPKNISALQREALGYLNENIGRDYDPKLILTLAKRKILKRQPSVEDFAKANLFSCSSRMGILYRMIGIEVVPEEKLHFSQFEPRHFAESDDFRKIAEWVRRSN